MIFPDISIGQSPKAKAFGLLNCWPKKDRRINHEESQHIGL